MSEPCKSPIDLGDLAAYRLGELDAASEQALEEHYFGCAECTARLAWLDSLAESVSAAVRAGSISANVSSGWITAAAAQGINMRSYEIPPGGTVHCTVHPKDDFVVVRLRVDAPLRNAFDVDVEMTDLKSGAKQRRQFAEVSMDPDRGEVVYAFSGHLVRSFPRSLWAIELRPHGEQDVVWSYTMDHTPWEELETPR